MLSTVSEALRASGLFQRDRTDIHTRALGIVLYHLGLSLRDTSLVLRHSRSHEAIRKWYLRASSLFDVQRAPRRVIAIDESKIKIEGQWRYLWAAIDVDTWEVLAVWITRGRSGLEARMFLRRVLRRCRGRPRVLVDGGPWYRWALDSLGLVWEHVTFGERNPVEQWFGILKQRIKRFYKRWPHNATVAQAQWWIESFVALYHIKRLPEALS